jgi:hypothetical protein
MLVTKKTLPIATTGAMLLALGTVGTAPATAALFRLSANFNEGSQLSVIYDVGRSRIVGGDGTYVSYNDVIVDFSFVSPTFSFSSADLGTPDFSVTSIFDVPGDGKSDFTNDFGISGYSVTSHLLVVGDAFAPVTPTSLQTERRGSFVGNFGTPNFQVYLDNTKVVVNNSGGTYEIARVPIASTPEPVVPWWFAGALVGGWWLRGLWVGRKQ